MTEYTLLEIVELCREHGAHEAARLLAGPTICYLERVAGAESLTLETRREALGMVQTAARHLRDDDETDSE